MNKQRISDFMKKKWLGIPVFVFLIFGVASVLAVSTYYLMMTTTIHTTQPIQVTGILNPHINCSAGSTCMGSTINISKSTSGITRINIVSLNNTENITIDINSIGEPITKVNDTNWYIDLDGTNVSIIPNFSVNKFASPQDFTSTLIIN